MNVDKARFLLLTTAISAATAVALSASGCTVQEKDKDTGSSGNVPTDSGGGGTDSSTDATTGDSSTDGGGDGGACLADDGIAPVCSDAGTGYTCETACTRYGVNFKKGIARNIKDCFYKLPTCEGADVDTRACVDNAARAACADPSAVTYCATLYCATSTAVGTLQKDDCEAVAKLLSTTGRTNFTSCITEAGGPCAANADLCIDTIQ